MRVCCDDVFSSVFYPIGFSPTARMAAVSDGGFICCCANWITRMPSIVFDVHNVGIGCKDQVCNMSVRCYECRDRTHVNWRYRTLNVIR